MEVFAQIQKYNIRLNLKKCVFGAKGWKFWGFMLTDKRIKVNPDNC